MKLATTATLVLALASPTQALDLNVGPVQVQAEIKSLLSGGGQNPSAGVNVGVGGINAGVNVNTNQGVHVGGNVNTPAGNIGVQIDIDPNTPGIQPPPPGTPPPQPPAPGPVPPLPEVIDRELGGLTSEELAILLGVCQRVRQRPGDYTEIKRAICELLASRVQ